MTTAVRSATVTAIDPPVPAIQDTGPRVIGLDLSLSCTGVAGPGWTDTIKPPSKVRGPERLDWIRARIVDSYLTAVDLVVIEGPSYGSQSRGQAGHHERAGLWWLVTHMLWRTGRPYAVVSPAARAKYATGKGIAGKADVVREVTRRFDWFAGGEDEADALVLMAMGRDWLGAPLVAVPQTHRAALDKAQWPDMPVLRGAA